MKKARKTESQRAAPRSKTRKQKLDALFDYGMGLLDPILRRHFHKLANLTKTPEKWIGSFESFESFEKLPQQDREPMMALMLFANHVSIRDTMTAFADAYDNNGRRGLDQAVRKFKKSPEIRQLISAFNRKSSRDPV